MSTWASRRKFTYASVIVIVVGLAVGIPLFKTLYHPPTCNDGIKNGSEVGVDCGGSCTRLCQNSYSSPKISWAKFEPVAPGRYNLGAYIENPNTDATAVNVPYQFSVFDKDGNLITYVKGATTLPPRRNTLAFYTGVDVGKSTPARVIFEFTEPPVWQKSTDKLGDIVVVDKKYTEDEVGSSLEVTIGNKSLVPYKNVYIFAILYDINGNTIGFSRTRVDYIAPGKNEVAPFTWPISRDGKVTTIEVLPVIPPVVEA